jgi:LCP family protein required for cell wall assembly
MQIWSRLRNLPQRTAVVIVVSYTVVVLVVALVVGNSLYEWSRQRILGSSALALLPNFEALAPRSLQNSTTTEQNTGADDMGADGAATAVNDASAVEPAPAINILLLGTDARPGERDVPRTDTMILLTLNPQSGTAGMLSLPRDLWVPFPGFGYDYKINMAYQLGENERYPGGGAQLAKDTVGSFVGQPVQYYVRVNFNGFIELIDLIGGIDLVVSQTIHDEQYPTDDYLVETFHLEAGAQHLDGATALKFVRTRNVDDDYGRARRQQQLIRAVADKVLRTDMVASLLPKLPRLLYTMRSSIETDIPMALQLELAHFVSDASVREVRQLVLDDRYGEETYAENGAWILRPDRAKVRSALATFFAPSTETGSGGTVALANPEWVRIEILNGTGEPGVAARARDLLQRQGWQVVSIGDADRGDYGRTIIINYGVPDELVDRVSSDLELDPNLSSLHGLNVTAPVDVRIVVGRDILSLIEP